MEQETRRARNVRRARTGTAAIALSLPLATALVTPPPAGGSSPHDEATASTAVARVLARDPVPAPPPPLAVASTSSTPPRAPGPPGDVLPAPRWELVAAYDAATSAVSHTCDLDPAVLAAMVEVASGSLRDRSVDERGVVRPAVVLKRAGRTPDTDAGVVDGDAHADHAVGPFGLPVAVWVAHRLDGDGDGSREVQDLTDAAISTAYLLCTAGAQQGRRPDLERALSAVWPSQAYVDNVLAWRRAYATSAMLQPWAPPLLFAVPIAWPTTITQDSPHDPAGHPSPPPGAAAVPTPASTRLAAPSPGQPSSQLPMTPGSTSGQSALGPVQTTSPTVAPGSPGSPTPSVSPAPTEPATAPPPAPATGPATGPATRPAPAPSTAPASGPATGPSTVPSTGPEPCAASTATQPLAATLAPSPTGSVVPPAAGDPCVTAQPTEPPLAPPAPSQPAGPPARRAVHPAHPVHPVH